jgi:GTPase SAR1 family protein
MFDLTRKSTLNSIKEWYRQGRGFNKTAIPVLVGTKYDHFVNLSREEQEEISNQVHEHPQTMTHYWERAWVANNNMIGTAVRQGDARVTNL